MIKPLKYFTTVPTSFFQRPEHHPSPTRLPTVHSTEDKWEMGGMVTDDGRDVKRTTRVLYTYNELIDLVKFNLCLY